MLQELEGEERATVLTTRCQEVGLTGLSIFYRLTRLYGFDIHILDPQCYNFERSVARYISISNNHKYIELTFARAELRREILKVRGSIHVQSSYGLSGLSAGVLMSAVVQVCRECLQLLPLFHLKGEIMYYQNFLLLGV